MTNDQKPKDDENLGSFYVGRRTPPTPERVLPKGGLTVIAVLVFIAVVWYAYPTAEEAHETTDLPVVLAEKAAFKFTPDDPGGMKVPHQDSTVFDPLDKKDAKRVERLLPGTEDPMDKDTALAGGEDTALAETSAQMQKIGIETEKVITAAETVKAEPVKPETAKPVQKPAAVKTETQPKTETVKTEIAKPAEKKAETKPAAKPAPVKAETAKTSTAKPAAQAAASTGNVYIQLGAYRSADGAAIDWKKLQQKHPELLKGLSMRTQRVDLGAKGVFNRLQAGGVSDARAREICDVLKTANSGGCIVVR
ncbi:MAG: SPOR domain-containing protein [Bdellovibrionales bacterium]|jgi:outer membrane biosynthesis protein TonB|nr:SPOR domain-containing protein [Bdellovibrionales bacterium]